MSANHDDSQKIKFVFDNLYQIYRQEVSQDKIQDRKPAIIPAAAAVAMHSSKILKTDALPAGAVRPFEPVTFMAKRLEQAKPLASSSAPVESLKANLKALNDIQSRLHFLLKEIESLSDPTDKE